MICYEVEPSEGRDKNRPPKPSDREGEIQRSGISRLNRLNRSILIIETLVSGSFRLLEC
jgi:hypothetical protein